MPFHDTDDVRHSHRNGHLSHEARAHAETHGVDSLNRAMRDATFHRGPLAGRTGDPFKDDSFFNPWTPGGTFNRRGH